MRTTEYKSVRFKSVARVVPGSPKQEIAAIAGRTGSAAVKLTRVTDSERDDLVIVSAMGTIDVPWTNVASAERAPVSEPEPKPEPRAVKGKRDVIEEG